MSNYWKNREVRQRKYALDRAIEILNEELRRCYSKSQERIINEMMKLYLEIMEDNEGKVLVSHLYQYNRYYELLNKITVELNKLGFTEKNIFENEFKRLYVQNQVTIGASFNLSSEINFEAVENAINEIWLNDGLNWSDRIWKDKEKLSQRLRESLIDSLATGSGTNKLVKTLMDDFNVSFHNAETLARTELAHIQNKSTLDKFTKEGITKVQILVDKNCCEECTENKGKVFDIANAPQLPIHPNCRCVYMAVID